MVVAHRVLDVLNDVNYGGLREERLNVISLRKRM